MLKKRGALHIAVTSFVATFTITPHHSLFLQFLYFLRSRDLCLTWRYYDLSFLDTTSLNYTPGETYFCAVQKFKVTLV